MDENRVKHDSSAHNQTLFLCQRKKKDTHADHQNGAACISALLLYPDNLVVLIPGWTERREQRPTHVCLYSHTHNNNE